MTNKMKHQTTSNDCCLLGKEYVNGCTEASDLGILVVSKMSFNQQAKYCQ
jgi:hypothetical protein